MTTYQYLTKWFPGRTQVSLEEDKELVSPGFVRIYADVTMAGTLVLYRKEIEESVEKKD